MEAGEAPTPGRRNDVGEGLHISAPSCAAQSRYSCVLTVRWDEKISREEHVARDVAGTIKCSLATGWAAACTTLIGASVCEQQAVIKRGRSKQKRFGPGKSSPDAEDLQDPKRSSRTRKPPERDGFITGDLWEFEESLNADSYENTE
eukprot:gene7914-13804_t